MEIAKLGCRLVYREVLFGSPLLIHIIETEGDSIANNILHIQSVNPDIFHDATSSAGTLET